MRDVIVTGACSAIGQAIIYGLKNGGYEPVNVCRHEGIDLSSKESVRMATPVFESDKIHGIIHVAEVGAQGFQNLLDAFLPCLQHGGPIVLISSVHVINHIDDYAKSKEAQEDMIRSMAKRGHRANILRLGHIAGTRPWPRQDEKRTDEIPLSRFGRTDEVATAVTWMVNCTWLCGSTITLDGGMSLLY